MWGGRPRPPLIDLELRQQPKFTFDVPATAFCGENTVGAGAPPARRSGAPRFLCLNISMKPSQHQHENPGELRSPARTRHPGLRGSGKKGADGGIKIAARKAKSGSAAIAAGGGARPTRVPARSRTHPATVSATGYAASPARHRSGGRRRRRSSRNPQPPITSSGPAWMSVLRTSSGVLEFRKVRSCSRL